MLMLEHQIQNRTILQWVEYYYQISHSAVTAWPNCTIYSISTETVWAKSTLSILNPTSDAANKPVSLRVNERTAGSKAALLPTLDMKSSRHGQVSSRHPPALVQMDTNLLIFLELVFYVHNGWRQENSPRQPQPSCPVLTRLCEPCEPV